MHFALKRVLLDDFVSAAVRHRGLSRYDQVC